MALGAKGAEGAEVKADRVARVVPGERAAPVVPGERAAQVVQVPRAAPVVQVPRVAPVARVEREVAVARVARPAQRDVVAPLARLDAPEQREQRGAQGAAELREHAATAADATSALGEKLRQARLLVSAKRAADRDELQRVRELTRSADLALDALLEKRFDRVVIPLGA